MGPRHRGVSTRLIVLLLLLLIIAGVFGYERFVMLPSADELIAKAVDIYPGTKMEEVHAALGREPSSVRTVQDDKTNPPTEYIVETYRFGIPLPPPIVRPRLDAVFAK
jgi:hypothetical protein